MDQRLAVSVEMKGLVEKEEDLESYFNLEYDDRGFELSKEEDANLKVNLSLKTYEVFDTLLPPEGEMKLYKGTCRLKLFHEGEELLNRAFHSRVIASRDKDQALEEILFYLKEEALIRSLGIFSRTFDEDDSR